MPLFWWRARRIAPGPAHAANALLAMLVVQVGLGIATLLNHVPVALASMHQAGAMVLFGLLIWTNHEIRRA